MPLSAQLSQDLSQNDLALYSAVLLKRTAPNLQGVLKQTLVLTAARTLLDIESGAEVIFNAAAGFTVTLPAPIVGMSFSFRVGTSVTSSNHKIITDAGTTFLKGSLLGVVEDTTPAANPGPKDFLLNGTTHVAVTMNGTTTGGLHGTWYEFRCIAATIWLVNGYNKGSGAIATPAATS